MARGPYKGSEKTRQKILAAALACFTEKGFTETSVEDIREASGVSNGSIYHHFRSKEGVAAAVYVAGVARYQGRIIRAVEGCPAGEEGVSALVSAHLAWVHENPDWARYLFRMRHAGFMDRAEEDMARQNRLFGEAVLGWIKENIRAGVFRDLNPALALSLVLGPCQEVSRLWLFGPDLGISPKEAAEPLARSVWDGLRNSR